jgi:hypothetical protein
MSNDVTGATQTAKKSLWKSPGIAGTILIVLLLGQAGNYAYNGYGYYESAFGGFSSFSSVLGYYAVIALLSVVNLIAIAKLFNDVTSADGLLTAISLLQVLAGLISLFLLGALTQFFGHMFFAIIVGLATDSMSNGHSFLKRKKQAAT